MPKVRTEQWLSNPYERELSYAERRNKSVEKLRIGKMRLAIYKNYAVPIEETLPNNFSVKFFYTFSDSIRNTSAPLGTYGSYNVTFRWLYAYLSSRRGTGQGLLDEYFAFEVYNRFPDEIQRLRELFKVIQTRRNLKGRFVSKQVQSNAKDFLSYFESIVKRDCIEFVREGGLGYVSDATLMRRERAGIFNEESYFATGQLINDIEITIIGGNG